jgi:DNA-3-methyladenine glycosylase
MCVLYTLFVTNKKLDETFFCRDAETLAQALIGKHLVFGKLRGKIVETEAYLGSGDPACHARNGITARTTPMFDAGGRRYVYFIYGMYNCFNVVSGKAGEGEAVLIRALQPLEGIAEMQERRKTRAIEKLCNGPGKLTQAFAITRAHNNLLLTEGNLRIEDAGEELCETDEIIRTRRIGLAAGKELELRFVLKNSKFASRATKAM